MQFYRIVLLIIAAVLVCRVQCRSRGPPADEPANRNRVCNDMLPAHPPNNPANPQAGNGGYTISTTLPRVSDTEYAYTAGQTYSLTVSGSIVFQGFLVIAHVPGQPLMLLGGFNTGAGNQQIIEECDTALGVNTQAAIGHSGTIGATSTTFSWTAPDADGMVDFRFTVVRSFSTFFVAQSAAQTSLQAIVDPTAPVPTTEPVTTVPPVPPTPPMRDPENYRLTFRTPPNCLLDECRVFVGIDTNVGSSSYLDITMQGVAGGWLAVGFSFTQNMFDADVVGCVRDPNDNSVMAIDTWNALTTSMPARNNIRDTTQDVILFNSSFVNETISCTFSRLITGNDPAPQDRDLDNDYFILYGYRGADNPANEIMRFVVHDVTPSFSSMMINPVNDTNQPFSGVTVPMRDPEDYRLTFRTPEGCNVTNCTTFVGIDTNTGNPGVLDIYMEGEAQGWVAVGFTETQNMFDADVVACNRNPITDMIEALDTYNAPPGTRNNLVDARQNVLLFNGSFDGSRIICTVGKEITPSDPTPQDISLDSNLYVLWGVRVNDSAAGRLLTHVPDVPANSQRLVPIAVVLDTPVRDPLAYRLIFRSPDGCAPSQCDIFIGIDTNTGNSGYLDIYMEASTTGWVAVGFSDTRNMFAADVVGCNRDPNNNDMVEAVDTWNEPDVRLNVLDANQDVMRFTGNFANGRITCTVAKLIVANGDQDLDLSTPLFVMYGVGPTGTGPASLPAHRTGAGNNPLLSNQRFNATADNNNNMRDPTDYRLTFRDPPSCTPSACDVFIGIDTNIANPSLLDIYMEASTTGWVAVGFSASSNMFAADVVGCNRDPNNNDMVEAVDTWNEPNIRLNVLDTNQDVMRIASSFNNGRITCIVTKQVAPNGDQDLDLNTQLFVMYGVGPSGTGAASLPVHRTGPGNPLLSNQQFNVIIDINNMRDPMDYRLTFSDPPGCTPSACDVFIGIDTNIANRSLLDIYMEASTTGWVAVGFSASSNMFAADVVGCNRDPNNNDMVEAVDTWNEPNIRLNVLDTNRDVMRIASSFNNGRITCTVTKQIAPNGDQDLDLNTQLFVMYGVGLTGTGAASLPIHRTGAGNPLLSQQTVNPAEDIGNVGNDFPRAQLLRAHGILMLIAWPLLAVSGIFFAAWMRPALPNGEWFKIHRAFLLSSLFVGAIGFMLAFIAHAQNPTPGLITLGSDNPVGTAHYVIGIIVMFLHILNPIISAFRCHPGEKYRWVFNLIHGTTIGLLVEILALTNIALGLERFGSSSFFGESNPLTIFWVYIGFLIFFLVVIGVLFLVFTLLSLFSQDDDRSKTAPSLIKPLIGSGPDSGHKPVPTNEGVELAVPGQKPAIQSGDDSEKPKVPSKDSPLRWGALTIFLSVNVTIMLILIILIALE